MCAVPCGWGGAPPLGSVLVILQGNIVDAPNPSVPHGCLRQDRGDPYHQLGPPGRGQISPTPLGEWVWFCKVFPAVIPTYRRMCSVGCWGTRLMRRTIFQILSEDRNGQYYVSTIQPRLFLHVIQVHLNSAASSESFILAYALLQHVGYEKIYLIHTNRWP